MKLIIVFFILVSTFSNASSLTFFDENNVKKNIALTNNEQLGNIYKYIEKSNVDWRAAIITNERYNKKNENLKVDVFNKITTLKYIWVKQHEYGLVNSLRLLELELNKIRTTGRLAVNLDPDYLRFAKMSNKKLNGDYTLYLPTFKEKIKIIGLVNAEPENALINGGPVASYFMSKKFLPGGDENWVYLIDSDATITKSPISSWNARHVEPGPRSTLFVGFDESLFPEEYKNLNKMIAEYLSHQIPE